MSGETPYALLGNGSGAPLSGSPTCPHDFRVFANIRVKTAKGVWNIR